MTNNEIRVSNERLDEQGLLAAGIAMAKLRGMSVADEVDQRMFGSDAETVVRAYLQALRSTPVEAKPEGWMARPSQFDQYEYVRGPHQPSMIGGVAVQYAYALYARPLPNPSPSDGDNDDSAESLYDALLPLMQVDAPDVYGRKVRAQNLILAALQSSKQGQP